jgi:PAS domain S-box-containing protein
MLIVSLVSAGLFFGLSVHYLIQYEFVSRLALLDKSLSEISISQDMSRRVRVRGKDEMAHLGDSINRMLESLERYQADLAMSRETAQALMNASIDTAFLVDLEGRILENNRPPQGLLLGGDQPEDRPIVDRHFDEVLEPEWADFLKGCVGIVAQQDEGLRFEKEDANRILDFSMYPVFNTGGKCNSVAIFIRDITRRRRAEDSLKERERQYREIVEYANSIILRWGMDGNIRYINDFGLRFFGFKPDELIGKPIVGTLVADDARSGGGLRHIMDDIREHPELYIWHENENRRWNGEKVFVAWGNKPILDEDGNIVEILSMGIDVTESKRRGGKSAPAE